jgi:hypothetical protein
MRTRLSFQVYDMVAVNTAAPHRADQGKLIGGCDISLHEVLEHNAQNVMFGVPYAALQLRDSRGRPRGKIKASIALVENLGGMTATHANPASRPRKPLSLGNARKEVFRFYANVMGVLGVFTTMSELFAWKDKVRSAIALFILVSVCTIEFWTARALVFLPLYLLVSVLFRYTDRINGSFVDRFIKADEHATVDGKTTAKLLVSVVDVHHNLVSDVSATVLLDVSDAVHKRRPVELGRFASPSGSLYLPEPRGGSAVSFLPAPPPSARPVLASCAGHKPVTVPVPGKR